jgi:NAD(P)-dependent dehydrogenase (short-subunit alcohol dehydrogenase family)
MPDQIQRVAVVTGANRGLGRGIARGLAMLGLRVVLTARSLSAAEAAAAELNTDGLPVSGAQLDVTDPASVVRVIADTAHELGRLDVLVNNAGIAIDPGEHAVGLDLERVHATFNANVVGAWRCSSAAVPKMRANGYGRIVNVTSHMATFGHMGAGSPSYRVSKAALNALTCVLAAELRDDNILVNAASPGQVATRMTYGKADLSPDDAADTFTWLATLPDNGPTGQLFHNRQPIPW